jgi:hypothetical protein
LLPQFLYPAFDLPQGILADAQARRISLIIQADDHLPAFLFAKADKEIMISFQAAKDDFFSRVSDSRHMFYSLL